MLEGKMRVVLITLVSHVVFVSDAKTLDLEVNHDLIESSLSTVLSHHTATSNHSHINVIQNGIENVAIVGQAAQDGLANIEQHGIHNFAEIYQFGYDNTADIKQYGTNNSTSVLQGGIGNIASITQYGQQQFSVQQFGQYETIQIIQY